MNQREKLASENGMAIEFVNWFFDHKKDGCGNAWFMMMAAMWEGWSAREAQVKQLAAENALKQEFISTCFRAAGEGGDMDGNDIQELGERLGLFERQTYQPALHGYICGHEAGEDSVYVMKASPATDAILASLRAEGVEMFAKHCSEKSKHAISSDTRDNWWLCGEHASDFAAHLRNEVPECYLNPVSVYCNGQKRN